MGAIKKQPYPLQGFKLHIPEGAMFHELRITVNGKLAEEMKVDEMMKLPKKQLIQLLCEMAVERVGLSSRCAELDTQLNDSRNELRQVRKDRAELRFDLALTARAMAKQAGNAARISAELDRVIPGVDTEDDEIPF